MLRNPHQTQRNLNFIADRLNLKKKGFGGCRGVLPRHLVYALLQRSSCLWRETYVVKWAFHFKVLLGQTPWVLQIEEKQECSMGLGQWWVQERLLWVSVPSHSHPMSQEVTFIFSPSCSQINVFLLFPWGKSSSDCLSSLRLLPPFCWHYFLKPGKW